MFEKTLTDLIRGIRANKKNEQKYIAACLQEIHQEVKSNDPDVKAAAVSKLTYVRSIKYFIEFVKTRELNFLYTIFLVENFNFSNKRLRRFLITYETQF